MCDQYNHNNNNDNNKGLDIVQCTGGMYDQYNQNQDNNVNETMIACESSEISGQKTTHIVRQKHVNFQLHLTREYKDCRCS